MTIEAEVLSFNDFNPISDEQHKFTLGEDETKVVQALEFVGEPEGEGGTVNISNHTCIEMSSGSIAISYMGLSYQLIAK